MRNLILITALSTLSAPAMADVYDEQIASQCEDVKEVTYASYINAQSGVAVETTLVRLSSIYSNDNEFEFMARFVKTAYTIPAPTIETSLKDAATTVGRISRNACVKVLREAVDGIIEDQSDDKVGM